MLAYRRTYIVKRGSMNKALKMLSAQIERTTREGQQIRVYTPDISPNTLVFESVHESEEAHQEYWADVHRDEGSRAFYEKWCEVAERKESTERWKLTEWK